MKEMVGGCCVCSDDRGWPENPLVYCDGQSCTVAVHQACYGIVTVPTGPWYCRKCESQERAAKVKCELCPSKYGALKRTDNSGWAHVVCALYIPEVRFGNVTTMEPIQLQLIPQERFSKICYICQENGKPANANVGACMQCNRSGCKQQFHVTCAQSLGLLCEEAGNYLDNVKYCGYCQHHYSKLKKGGNVKTIPPYKPVASETLQSDSSSEKDAIPDPSLKPTTSVAPLGKRKAATNKTAVSKANVKAPAYQKPVVKTAGEKSSTKSASSVKSAKSVDDTSTSATPAESEKVEKKESEVVVVEKETPSKDSGGKGKKRKANSRTPTPNITSENNSSAAAAVVIESAPANSAVTKKDSPPVVEPVEKPKKAKTENLPQAASPKTSAASPLLTATTNTATTTVTTSNTTTATSAQETTTVVVTTPTTTTATSSIIQPTPPINSVVVSVPLHNTSLSPHHSNLNNPISPHPIVQAIVTSTPPPPVEERTKVQTPVAEIVSPSPSEDSNMITSEISGGGLKITFEKQPGAAMPLDLEDVIPSHADIPNKRSRSQSVEKIEKITRSKKKNANGLLNSAATASVPSKRSSRSQHNTPPPSQQPTTFVNMPQSSQIKDSPPSSPSSESLGAPPTLGRKKGRKSAPASVSTSNSNSNSKDSKDNIKLFQNGINAPHMMGNQLNLNSKMAQNMSDHLNSEMEAHSIFTSGENSSSLVGPQLHHRVIASARSSSAGGSSTASGGSGLSSMLGGNGGAIPQTLDQLLERQWEQGSQFLMEQAQHFDIASLLSCLHQLRAENLRLEEHVSSLLQRRDHLLAVNARLAIPLTGPPATPQSSHPHTVNNIHPAVAASHTEAPRARHGNAYPSHVQAPQHPSGSMENGISPEQAGYPLPHRSPAGTQPQPSPNIRQSSGYTSSGLLRQTTESSGGRSAPRSHNYPLYQGPSNAQQQMVIRRDSDQPPHSSQSKPS